MRAREFLSEAAAPTVGRKYQHIEDLVLSNGSLGGMHAVERMRHMGLQGGHIELKWDGMPVIYWGRDQNGTFRMIPKNAWQYLKGGATTTKSGAPVLMSGPNDILSFVMGTGKAGTPQEQQARKEFGTQLAKLWPYFEKISPKQGYLEGGLLFYPGTKPDGESAMPSINQETQTYDFKPNITEFHVPIASELGQRISQSKMMVAVTGYYETLGSADEGRFNNAEQLSVPGIIVQGTTYVQEPIQIDNAGLKKVEAFIQKNAQLIDNYLAPKQGLKNPGAELYSYLNKHLRITGLLRDFPAWAQANLSAGKQQILLSDTAGLQATLGAVEALGNEKMKIINTLNQGTHGGIKQTNPEGYAQAHPGVKFKHDIPGQFVKTIDQLNWKPRQI